MKKALLLLAAVLLAGCTLPGDDGEDETPAVFGACPHWIAGPGSVQASLDIADGPEQVVVGVSANGTGENETARSHAGRPLDMFLIEVNATSPAELRVHALRGSGAERLLIHHVEGGVWKASPFLRVEGVQEIQVYLADTAFGAQTAPAPVRVQVQAETDARVDLDISPFYRVCGIPLKEP